MGILTTATFRANRLGNSLLGTGKDLKKTERSLFDFCRDQNTWFHLVKWIYNKYVMLGLTFPEVSDESAVKLWDVKQRQRIDVRYPDIVCSCNHSMGGVDLAYMLRAFYHRNIKCKQWYWKVIFVITSKLVPQENKNWHFWISSTNFVRTCYRW